MTLILSVGPGSFPEISANLRKVHKLPIPEGAVDLTELTADALQLHKIAFTEFLKFLKNNLSGQTSIRVDPAWAGQLTLLQGMAQFGLPDAILREESLRSDLAALAAQIGVVKVPALAETHHRHDEVLRAIYDAPIEGLARDAYARDYTSFGFEDWS